MSGHLPRYPALPPRTRWILTLVAIALAFAAPARAQVADVVEDLGDVGRMTLRRVGTFEVWRDSTRLGTEFYREWLTPNRDSVIAMSRVRYDLRDAGGAVLFQKHALFVGRGHDLHPLLYQSLDFVGERRAATRCAVHDTFVTVFHEADGGGRGTSISLPPGRFAILDAGLYQQVESMLGEFRDRPIKDRVQSVLLPMNDTIVTVRITRGPRETLQLPGWGPVSAERIDLVDDWTMVHAWFDERGRMVQLQAPVQGVRVVRLVPGAEEAEAASLAKGPPLPGNPPPAHLR